jgi:hypothetical protein
MPRSLDIRSSRQWTAVRFRLLASVSAGLSLGSGCSTETLGSLPVAPQPPPAPPPEPKACYADAGQRCFPVDEMNASVRAWASSLEAAGVTTTYSDAGCVDSKECHGGQSWLHSDRERRGSDGRLVLLLHLLRSSGLRAAVHRGRGGACGRAPQQRRLVRFQARLRCRCA